MFYVKSSVGEKAEISNANVFTRCPKCGKEHKVDLVSLIIEHGEDCYGDILDSTVYCEECSAAHLPMWEHMDEIEFLASQFPGVEVSRVEEIVRNGLDHGAAFETALIGARLTLAAEAGSGSLFTLDEVASALPGFEWLQ